MSRALAASAVLVAALAVAPGTALAAGGLEIMPTPSTIVPLIVLFALMVVPVNKLIIQPLLSVLDEREERIAGARKRAEEISRRADETLSSYEANIASARADAETERRGTLEEARGRHADRVAQERGNGETQIAQARADVASALESARGQLQSQAQDLAQQAAERMLGRSL